MVIEKTKNTINGSIFGIVNKLIITIFPFIIRTLIIKCLGEQYAGLNGLFSSILEVLSLAELGFGSAMVYNMYKPIDDGDKTKIRALLMYYKKIYLLLGTIILLIGLCITPFIQYFINGTYPSDINLHIVFMIYLINSSCSYFALAYQSSILIAHQRNDIKYNIHSILIVFMYIIQIIVLVVVKNYYVYIIFTPVFTILINVITAIVTRKKFPDYYPKGSISIEEKKNIRKLLKALIGHRLGAVVLNATDNIVISAFLGLTILTIFGNYYYILNAVFSMIYIIAQSMVAGIANLIIKSNIEYNEKLLMHLLFAFSVLVGICSCCFVGLYQLFMKIWVGEEFVLPFVYVLLFTFYFYVRSIRYVILVFKDACGMWQADFWKPYVESLTNLVINIVLVLLTKQLWGIILSSIISMLFVAFPWEVNVFYKNYFDKNPSIYYFNIIKYFLVNIIVIAITFIVSSFTDYFIYNDYINLIVKLILIVCIGGILYVLVYFRTENFKFIIEKLFRKFKK